MTDHHIPDVVLERYRLNELVPQDAATVAERLGRDARLRERLAMLEHSDAVLREHLAPMERRLAARPRPARRHAPLRALWKASWAIPAAVVIASVTIVVVARRPAPVRESASGDRVKGTSSNNVPGLALYRRTAGGSERLADGAVVHTGDLIRVGYRAAGRTYGLIVSIDGAGGVTMHLPPAGDRAAALKDGVKDGATTLLDQAYELDEAPRWEQFYFVAGRTAFDVAPILRAARDAAGARTGPPPAGLALPRGLDQASFTLQKESRP